MISRAILLALLAVIMVQADPIYFRVTLDCDYSIRSYCGSLIIYEEDLFVKSNDVIMTEHFCTSEKTREVTYGGFEPDGDWTPEYEFGYRLTHNCTSDGSYRCVKHDKLIDVNTSGLQNVEINRDIFNKGEEGGCKHPNVE